LVRKVSFKSKLPTPTIFAGFKPGFTLERTASNYGFAEETTTTTTMNIYEYLIISVQHIAALPPSVLSLLLSISAFLLPHLTHSRHHRIDRIHNKPDHGLAFGEKKCLEDADSEGLRPVCSCNKQMKYKLQDASSLRAKFGTGFHNVFGLQVSPNVQLDQSDRALRRS